MPSCQTHQPWQGTDWADGDKYEEDFTIQIPSTWSVRTEHRHGKASHSLPPARQTVMMRKEANVKLRLLRRDKWVSLESL